ncbi:hypothetical protein P5673_028438, partial [Acropora cervicornis]
QKPSLKARRGYRFIPQDDWMVYNHSFILSEGYWKFVVSSVRHYDTTIWIDGQSVSLLDRFTSSKCFLTQDNFASVEEVKVPVGLLAVCVD